MKETELKEISEKYDDCDIDTVLHFVLSDDFAESEDNFYLINTDKGQKVAIECGSGEGDGLQATSPRDTIFSVFKNELHFSDCDYNNLQFKGDCGDTIIMSPSSDAFFRQV